MTDDILENTKCVICGNKATVIWPFIDDKPAFCSEHIKAEYSGKYGVWPESKPKPKILRKEK